ncbi:fms-related tyrosine kinase 3 ligand [Dendrobates tinctorius]|uniref:fms-related tyrosine kinase 3 ligand n=1 Tax=Dendrobates tinctorius TaxID=92724 RepID=UPI003CC95224
MINCHVLRVKDIVFFWLVIWLELGNSCIFENDPISDEYMRKTQTLADYLPNYYNVDLPRMVPEEEKDQNCQHLLRLFLINSQLGQMTGGRELSKIILNLQIEIHFIQECLFKIPLSCSNKTVSMSSVLRNLDESLTALKTNIESNFTHCLHVKCETDKPVSTMKSTIEDHTASTLNINGNSDHIIDPAKQSSSRLHTWLLLSGLLTLFVVSIMVFVTCWKSRSQGTTSPPEVTLRGQCDRKYPKVTPF